MLLEYIRILDLFLVRFVTSLITIQPKFEIEINTFDRSVFSSVKFDLLESLDISFKMSCIRK